jgi:2-oxoglutarate dehydrogenase E1 component
MKGRAGQGKCIGLAPEVRFFPMNRSTVGNRWNLELIEENYRRWQTEPSSVPESWRNFFEGYELAQTNGAPPGEVGPDPGLGGELESARAQASVTRLVDAYREIGHYLADSRPETLMNCLSFLNSG